LYEPFLVCIEDLACFLKAFVVSPILLFFVIFGSFSWEFRCRVLEVFFAVFSMGVTHEDLVPLFLVTLPLQTHGMLSDLVVFGGA
jgi:hypothetical protein